MNLDAVLSVSHTFCLRAGVKIMKEMIQLIAAMLGSLGFSAIFNVRGEKLIFATLGGFLAWGVYLGLAHIDNNPYFCGFVATVLLTFYAETMAMVHKTPVTVFLVSGAIPMVPGAGLYRAMSRLVERDWTAFSKEISYTLLFAASMAAGITFTTIIYRMVRRWTSRQLHM